MLIQKAVGRGWQTVLTLHTTAGGVFYARSSLGSGLLLRATLAGVSSLPWSPR